MKGGKNKTIDFRYISASSHTDSHSRSPQLSPTLASPSPFSFPSPAFRLSDPSPPALTYTPQSRLPSHLLHFPQLPDRDSDYPPKPRLIRYRFETPPRYRPEHSPKPSEPPPALPPKKLPKLDANPHIQSLPTTTRPSDLHKPIENHCTIVSLAVKTRTGAIHGKRKRTNQDSALVVHSFAGGNDQTLLGIFDGHGVNGHLVADFLRKTVPGTVGGCLARGRKDGGWEMAVKEGLRAAAELLGRSYAINSAYSGSTAIVVLQRGGFLACGNVGDSRGVVGRRLGGDQKVWTGVELSRDHKPEIPEERKRIEAAGGRVEQAKGGDGEACGPLRVWLHTESFPGLAMSRSIGDAIASQIGVSSEAEICEHHLVPEDKFFLLASDGVWEVFSTEEVSRYIVCQAGWETVGNWRG